MGKKKNDHPLPRMATAGGRWPFDLVDITVRSPAFPSEDNSDDVDEQVRQLDAIIARCLPLSPTQRDAAAIPVAHPALSAAWAHQLR